MLEILFLWFLTRQIRNIVEPKGRKPFGYQAMLVVFWFGGEILGAFIGSLLFRQSDSQCLVYIPALVCAGIGAGIAFLIASSVSPVAPQMPTYPGQVPPAMPGAAPPSLGQIPPPTPAPGPDETSGSGSQAQ